MGVKYEQGPDGLGRPAEIESIEEQTVDPVHAWLDSLPPEIRQRAIQLRNRRHQLIERIAAVEQELAEAPAADQEAILGIQNELKRLQRSLVMLDQEITGIGRMHVEPIPADPRSDPRNRTAPGRIIGQREPIEGAI